MKLTLDSMKKDFVLHASAAPRDVLASGDGTEAWGSHHVLPLYHYTFPARLNKWMLTSYVL